MSTLDTTFGGSPLSIASSPGPLPFRYRDTASRAGWPRGAAELEAEAQQLSTEAQWRHDEADAKRAEAQRVESDAEERARAARAERDAATQLSDRAREVDPDRD